MSLATVDPPPVPAGKIARLTELRELLGKSPAIAFNGTVFLRWASRLSMRKVAGFSEAS